MLIKTPLDVGFLVKDRRKKLGLTQGELAARLGVSRLWILQLEQGKTTVQLGLVLRALNELNLPMQVDPIGGASRPVTSSAAEFDAIIREAAGEYDT